MKQNHSAAPMLSTDRLGDWFTTFTGLKFYPLDPRPEEIRIADIAHALSMLCRYGGHCREFYSVAQHSLHVCEWVQENFPGLRELALQALIHDASEAYIGDMVRPLKLSMPAYRQVESRLEKVVYEALRVPAPDTSAKDAIKFADNTLLMTERRDFVNAGDQVWSTPHEPWAKRLYGLSPSIARAKFLHAFGELIVAVHGS
jgi:uncharacterized protein